MSTHEKVPTAVPSLTLNDGTAIPQLGFGVWQVDPDRTEDVVTRALEVGYRHIDTAQMYGNETGVGAAIAGSGLARDDVYVTSKLNNNAHRPEDVRRTFAESLGRLGLDEVDLFLIHWPLPTQYDGDFAATWEAMAGLVGNGARSVGVSNFQPGHLDRIVEATGVVPAVNQIEVHPFFTNEEARSATLRHGALVEAWSPAAGGRVLDHPTIAAIAAEVDRTPTQVALRWQIERGDIVFPKTTHTERMQENLALFDFQLSPDQVATLNGLDEGEKGRTGPNPDTFDWIPD